MIFTIAEAGIACREAELTTAPGPIVDCSPELIERLRQSPVGVWSTDQMFPNGGQVEFCSDGTGVVVRCAGHGGYSVAFEWKSDGLGQLRVRALNRDDGEALDSDISEWHSTTCRIRTAVSYGMECLAIEFVGGVLWDTTFDLAFSDWPLAYCGQSG